MNRETAKEHIKEQQPYFLQEAKHKGFVCPDCKNGTGKDGDGITKQAGKSHYKCFKCGLYEDIFGLIGKHYNLQDFNDQFNKACELYNITVDYDSEITSDYGKPVKEKSQPVQDKAPVDYTAFYKECNDNINKEGNAGLQYLQDRGLSLETINLFNVGFVNDWKHPTTADKKNVPTTARVIIPTSNNSYLARDIRNDRDVPEEQGKYKKMKVGNVKLFNIDYLLQAKGNVFVVEGEIDAMSIIEAGGQAVGLGMAGNKDAFIDYVAEHRRGIDPAVTFTILPDNDTAGEESAKYIKEQLRQLEREAYTVNIFGNYKDANELLVKNREKLEETIKEINVDPAYYSCEVNNGKKTSDILQDFILGVQASINTPAIPTGFDDLDELLDGGLYEDFYILMAGTGHGKTAFILQVADHIAQAGHTVLFYNLEMSTYELMSRSISRETFKIACERYKQTDAYFDDYCFSARGITDGSRQANYNKEQIEIICDAYDRYGDYCDKVVFHEVLGYYDTNRIEDEVRYYLKRDGVAPVVIVDYLQMLSLGITLNSGNRALTERQAIDKAIYDLKSISRKYKTPVIALSSVNRDATKQGNKELKQEAGKESGNIEYTAGTLMSLDYALRSNKTFKEPEEAQQVPRRMKIFIHKNRYGVPKQETFFDYYSKCSYFVQNADIEAHVDIPAEEGTKTFTPKRYKTLK